METLQKILAKTINFEDKTKVAEKSKKIAIDTENKDVIKVIVSKASL